MLAPSIEEIIKGQFARQFSTADWVLFKCMAEFYFRRAVFLRKADVDIDRDLKLLARNCQKRLFIGIGVELLLKAAFLKEGFAINVIDRNQPNAPEFPFTFQQAQGVRLVEDKTYTLDKLIHKLHSVPSLRVLGHVVRGLKIAKVFRNKEGHVVLPQHTFDSSNYRDIEESLSAIYLAVFGKHLRIHFSLEPDEEGVWEIT